MNIFSLARLTIVAGMVLAGSAMAQKAPTLRTPIPKTPSQTPAPAVRTDYQEFARKMRVFKPISTTCYASSENAFTKVAPPAAFLQRRNGRVAADTTARFIVEYYGFSTEAKRAFQYAVDIWATLIKSDVPIRIKAYWKDLGGSSSSGQVIGSASPDDFRIGTDGTQKAFGVYPIALAEKIARRQLNHPDSADIYAAFNSNKSVNFYYGTDGNISSGQIDLVTVILHELGHGLGFIDGFSVASGLGYYGFGYPAVFDHFLENAAGDKLLNTDKYPDESQALAQQLTSGSIYFNGPVLTKKTGGKARMYAPSTFAASSSIAHLDESAYPKGSANSLMTPTVANAEVIHNPGPITLGMFEDMEWKTTSLLHTPFEDSEAIKDLVFRAQVKSDTTYDPASVKLYYYKGNTAPSSLSAFTSVSPTRVGNTNEYTYTLPASQAQGQFRYYFEVKDAAGRVYTNPGKNTAGGQVVNYFIMGPDNIAPTIKRHVPASYEFKAASDSLFIIAAINDDRQANLDTAYIEYNVNNLQTKTTPLFYAGNIGFDSVFVGVITQETKFLAAGDVVRYRIIARDKSMAKNQTILPASGFFETRIIEPQTTAKTSFTTSFAAINATDFVGSSFSIAQPSGFTDPAIHSTHPYANGTDIFYENNYTFNYLTPIKLKTNPDSATLRFDEIVLVEPGENGSRYGEAEFYDYVIVEGSSDGGRTWKALVDGYDSRDQTTWLTAYNKSSAKGDQGEDNSTTVGTPSLYKKREIYMLDNGNFKPNDNILIRFRLFADQLAHGWGWAIDNLEIQTAAAPQILANEPQVTSTFSVYPNPSSNGVMRVQARLAKATTEADLTVTSPSGQALKQMPLKVQGTTISEQLDLSQLPTGLYFLQLKAGDSVQTKKVMIVH